MKINIEKINELKEILLKCYSKETAYYKNKSNWSIENPTCGQCAITALIVQENFGGTIHCVKVVDEIHFFNIIDGEIVDLTKAQFEFKNVDIAYEENETVDRNEIFNEDSIFRYNILKQRMNNIMSKDKKIDISRER